MNNIERILITIDKTVMHEYNMVYKKLKPNTKTVPFAKKVTKKLFNKDGSPKLTDSGKNQKTKTTTRKYEEYTKEDTLYGSLSLNEILVINNRMTMNGIKDKWGEFGKWLSNKYGLSNKQISNAMMEFRVFSENKAKKDLDNLAGGIKFLNDGLIVKSGMLVDDNMFHLNPLLIVGDYDKNNPRTEIRISIFNENEKDIYNKLSQHIKNWE